MTNSLNDAVAYGGIMSVKKYCNRWMCRLPDLCIIVHFSSIDLPGVSFSYMMQAMCA